jgi:hypothetical protein
MKPEPCNHKVAQTGKLQGNGEHYITGNLTISSPRAMALKSLHNERDGLVTKRAMGETYKDDGRNPQVKILCIIYLFRFILLYLTALARMHTTKPRIL